ncbi:MAG: ferrous iron transport protein A [Clostridiales bacterium]|nr:ferrous iron transport protein A [Clostridiales bacterium]
MTALSLAAPGKNYTIKWNICRCDAEQEMKQVGLCPGETIYLLNSYFGNVIVCVNGKKIALSKELAFYIKV